MGECVASIDRFYAGGVWRSCGGGTGILVRSPFDDAEIGRVTYCTEAELDQAARCAREGFAVWSVSTLDERKAALGRLHAELASRTDAIVTALAREMGCPVWLGRLMQVPMPLRGIEFAIAGIDEITWQETIGNGLVERVPGGVVAAISPWNFPLHQIVAKVAASIAAGCAVILKPSELAPGAAVLFMEAVAACGLPNGVVNMVWGGPEIGAALVAHQEVDRVSFTGSTAVGRRILTMAAETLKPVTLELGGKSAAVLLDDAALDIAVPIIMRMALANSGQACVSQSRLIAPRHAVPEILDRCQAAAEAWTMGDPLSDDTRLGPLANAAQARRVRGMINHATQQGATLGFGGPKEGGCFVPPTVFTGVTPDMEVAREEVFGPVLAIMAYDTDEQAAAIANGTAYGLSGAVWSADPKRATDFARGLRTGQVVINGAAQNLATPFGGWNESGQGRENGRFGIEDLLNYRSLHGAV